MEIKKKIGNYGRKDKKRVTQLAPPPSLPPARPPLEAEAETQRRPKETRSLTIAGRGKPTLGRKRLHYCECCSFCLVCLSVSFLILVLVLYFFLSLAPSLSLSFSFLSFCFSLHLSFFFSSSSFSPSRSPVPPSPSPSPKCVISKHIYFHPLYRRSVSKVRNKARGKGGYAKKNLSFWRQGY